MIVVTGGNLTLHKNLGGGGLEPLTPTASAATGAKPVRHRDIDNTINSNDT